MTPVEQAQHDIDVAQWNYDHDTDIDDRRWDYEALLRARYRLAEAVASIRLAALRGSPTE